LDERPHARTHFQQRWQAALAEFSTQDLTTAAAVIDRLRTLFEDLGADTHSEARDE